MRTYARRTRASRAVPAGPTLPTHTRKRGPDETDLPSRGGQSVRQQPCSSHLRCSILLDIDDGMSAAILVRLAGLVKRFPREVHHAS
jgi:hypothetical protein